MKDGELIQSTAMAPGKSYADRVANNATDITNVVGVNFDHDRTAPEISSKSKNQS